MNIQDQIKFLKKSLEDGIDSPEATEAKTEILKSLECLKATYVGNTPGVVVHMSISDYRKFESFKLFQEFEKENS